MWTISDGYLVVRKHNRTERPITVVQKKRAFYVYYQPWIMEYERKLRVVARLYRRHKILGAPMSQDRTPPAPPPPPPAGNFLRVIE